MANKSFSPLTLSILLFLFIQILICIDLCDAVVPANETFKFVNEGELGQYISEYFGDYRALSTFTSPFQLCFYNQTPTAFTLALRMGLRRTESLMRWVWEANRGNPVDENATLTFGTDGNLVLARSDGQVAWQTSTANKGVVGLKVLPNGNMVLHDSKGRFLWQSFHSPTDTLLVGQSLKVGAVTKLVSRASADENVNGPYSLVMEPKGVHLYYKPPNSPNPIRYNSIALFTNLNKGQTLQNVTFEFENEYDAGFSFLLNLKYGVSNLPGANTILNRIKYNTTLSFLRLEIDGNLRIYTYNNKVDYGAWEVTFTLFLKAPPPLFQVTKAELASQSSECQLPKKCGNFGLCEDSQCVGCPSNGKPVLAWSTNCAPPKLKSCAQKDFHYNKLAGVDHYMIKYTSGDGPVKDNACGVKCTGDCKCLAYFYNQDTSRCWLAYDLSTLTRVVNATHLAYIKVPN
ncbi:hypothetical protein AgCh_005252 [Apium graveolens]